MAPETLLDSAPLISCIMPTRNRRPFVAQSIWYFLRQDYYQKELIIVDDGEDSIADLVPSDDRIRYVRLEGRRSLGAKRNLACSVSRGALIAHWDDDDWIAPHRLSVQVREVLASGADVCGLKDVLHYRLKHGDAWRYRWNGHDRPWVAGCTLLYRRAAWEEHPFPELDVGEDSAFVWSLPMDRIHAVPDSSFYVALIHSHNTAVKHLADPHWEQRPFDEISRLVLLDRDFYVSLRTGNPPRRQVRPSRPTATVTVGSVFFVYDGYGSMAEYLVLGMERVGAHVDVLPLTLDRTGLSPELQEILDRSRPQRDAPSLYFAPPGAERHLFPDAENLYMNTMWESDRLPPSWSPALNRARMVIVPTRAVATVCRQSGVTVPIEVIPEGVDPAIYHWEERPDRPGLTTLMVGPLVNRKNAQQGIEAWKEAFAGDPEARLILKARFRYRNYVPDDPRISFIDSNEPSRGIAHWYQQADVLLALGNEGFGLPLVEGMATGLPVVALDSEGQGDICEDARGMLLPVGPVRWAPYDETPYGTHGMRGVPDVHEVAAALRWVDTHRDEARAMGRAASDWVRQHRNVWSKGPAVLDVMERTVQPLRSLRFRFTFWVPSWGTPCGVAEYTGHLQAHLPAVHVTAAPPEPGRSRLVHVQHESSLFDDSDLTSALQQAQAAGVPVAVTEHAVGAQVKAWEREADALVALTSRGAAVLRARWPQTRVEWIPPGCPTWFPERKPDRGRVIGVFGFLESHKGYFQLLDVLRAIPGAELVMYSYPKSVQMEAMWKEASRGLPIRWERGYLPVEEVARRLAAEADILTFWYDEIGHASASYAVRIGLATGVPVLTSPTSWFEDLADVTYQPHDLCAGVAELLDNTSRRDRLTKSARAYCEDHTWGHSSERHLALWRDLERP